MSPEEKAQLIALFNAGRHVELESLARVLLEHYPEAGFVWKSLCAALQAQGKDALHAMQMTTRFSPGDAVEHCNLSAALHQHGQFDAAARSARMALKIKPDFLEAHCNLALALQSLGHHEQAVMSYHQALALNPNLAQIYNNLGNALHDLRQPKAAMENFDRALQIAPNFAMAHSNLGNALCEAGRYGEAVASCLQAIKIAPDFAAGYNNLGNALKGLGRLDEAVASYRRALQLEPRSANTHNSLGNALGGLGQFDAAITSFNNALQIQPDFAEAYNNVGVVWKNCGRFEEAMANYRHALKLKPDFAEAHGNLGDALRDLRRTREAFESYQHALKIKPDFAVVHSNLGSLWRDLGQFDKAIAHFRQALEIEPGYINARSNLLFTYNYVSNESATGLLAEAQRFGILAARQARPYDSWLNKPDPIRCLRIGLVSGDLCSHPVGFFIESILSALVLQAPEKLEFVAYSNRLPDDVVTARIKQYCYAWHSIVGLSDRNVAQQIRDDGIDILIDLSGHTAHNRLPLFAWKPAPVQLTWLGYFATTGVTAIDYLLADPWTVPEAKEGDFTETIWRLPETRLCFTAPDENIPVSSLPALRQGNGKVTFGCFNNLSKMNDAVVALWAKVLHAVPASCLFLKAKQLDDRAIRQDVIQRFAVHGIVKARLILEGASPRKDYLARYHHIDIVLDSFPFPGGTTTVEALWMGVPVLTLTGERFLNRQGVGLLMNAGMPDWIANDADDYVARAVSHAKDLPRLAALHNGLRQQVLASPLFDAAHFAHHFEEALRSMWTRWCALR